MAYDLVGIAAHAGTAVNMGHWVTWCRVTGAAGRVEWFHADDQHVEAGVPLPDGSSPGATPILLVYRATNLTRWYQYKGSVRLDSMIALSLFHDLFSVTE